MKNTSWAATSDSPLVGRTSVNESETNGMPFVLDTTFVLFFLALDFGQAWFTIGLDGLLASLTLIAFIVLPYFLPFAEERPKFWPWIGGRFILASFGITLGLVMKLAVGVLLPEWFRFMPMTLLIVSAIFSLYLQLYAILSVRLAR